MWTNQYAKNASYMLNWAISNFAWNANTNGAGISRVRQKELLCMAINNSQSPYCNAVGFTSHNQVPQPVQGVAISAIPTTGSAILSITELVS